MRYADDTELEGEPLGRPLHTAKDQMATLLGLQLLVGGFSRIQAVYVDTRVQRNTVMYGPCETLSGALQPDELALHPEDAEWLAMLARIPVAPSLTPIKESEPMTEARIESKIIDQHVEWMRENAEGLRLLDVTHRLNPQEFGSESIRASRIKDMGSQIAVDAFRRGLGVIALSEPHYRVERFMGAWSGTSRPIAAEPGGWLPAPPPADMIDPDSFIVIKIEGFGFPIGPREV